MRNDNPLKLNANFIERDEQVIIAVVSQDNMLINVNDWIVNFGATRHICANKESFSTYTLVQDGKKVVYLETQELQRFWVKADIGSK